jgi:hypothetical protein
MDIYDNDYWTQVGAPLTTEAVGEYSPRDPRGQRLALYEQHDCYCDSWQDSGDYATSNLGIEDNYPNSLGSMLLM